jgi:integrase
MTETYNLKTPHGRRSIPIDPKPYWQTLQRGLSLGYARSDNGGSWFVRKFKHGTKYTQVKLGDADDAAAVGHNLLSYKDAVKQALEWCESKDTEQASEAAKNKKYTIADVMADYLIKLERDKRKPQPIAATRIAAHILPTLGHILLRKLDERTVREWFYALADSAPRVRTNKGQKQAFRNIDVEHMSDAEQREYKRKRQLSANRILTDLKAALNHAYDQLRIDSINAWKRIKGFKKVVKPKIIWLTVDEARTLVEHCRPDFALLVQGALYTGARYSELGRLTTADFDADNEHMFFGETKEGRCRYVHLNDEAVAFFTELTRGHAPGQLIFTRRNGERWEKSHQTDPMERAHKASGITKPVSQHILRHSYASLSLMAGMDLETLSEQLGHSTSEITRRHYAHLADTYKRRQAKDHAPRFGFGASSGTPDKVIPIRRAANAS